MLIYRIVMSQLSKLRHMLMSDAPLWLALNHFKLNYIHRIHPSRSTHKKEQRMFREFADELTLDNDWFTPNIPTWLMAFEQNHFEKNAKLKCMEIGSWQGQSAVFILNYFENAKLTCVDTWQGADEHKSGDAGAPGALMKVEDDFDKNLLRYTDRLTKYKGTSYQFFNDNFERETFDLIYIDGSHHADDVMVDAVKAFEMLKVNGLMIFDDYFWRHYEKIIDNPSGAINAFIRLKSAQLTVVCFDYQLIIKKTENSIR